MIAEANSIFLQIGTFAKANPIIASAIGLWGLSVVTFLCRDIPRKVIDFIVYQSTTTLELNSQDEIFFQFLKWISTHKLHRFVRTLNLNNGRPSRYGSEEDEKRSGLSIGYGRMFFFHEGRLFLVYRSKESSNQTERVKETLSIRVLGRNQKIFGTLFEAAIKADDKDQIYTKIYTYSTDFWSQSTRQFKRDPATVAISPEAEEKLYSTIDSFIGDKDWYVKNGVPYRLGILLEGPPGTGKTSLIKAICAKYNRPLYLLNLGAVNDGSLLSALADVPEGAVVAIEDIDAQGVSVKRNEDEEEGGSAFKKPLTISGILNGLDGAASSENRIMIATTNHPEKLDSALVRPGRIDLILRIGNMETPAFKKYMSRMYEDFEMPKNFVLKEGITPAKVQQLVFQNKNNYHAVLEALK